MEIDGTGLTEESPRAAAQRCGAPAGGPATWPVLLGLVLLFLAGPACTTRLEAPAPRGGVVGSSACTADVECGDGNRCCGGACVTGNCCSSVECGGRACVDHRCQPCADDAACGSGEVCCGGLCREGACCHNGDCSSGQACLKGRCGTCATDGDCEGGLRCRGGACEAALSEPEPTDCGDGLCPMTRPHARALGASCQSTATCGVAEVCCGGACVAGECCSAADCDAAGYPAGTACLQNACQSCTLDAQCDRGSVCCGGSCQTGECCPGQLCAAGGVCNASGVCAGCTSDDQCGDGRVCCAGQCKAGDCCTGAQCGQYVCRAGTCSTCTVDGDCGANSLCCAGACVDGATCCDSTACAGGQLCRNNACSACARASDCGSGQVCCSGACRNGDCCGTADCSGGEVCNLQGNCGSCNADAQCGQGQKCCGGRCLAGTCCIDAECGAGKVCTGNSCQGCAKDADCGRLQVCCNGGCQAGNCCSPNGSVAAVPECGGLVCSGSLCSQCSSDVQCGAGSKCCRGACYAGLECCSSDDCGGHLACVSGRCSSCTTDQDCGALACCDADGPGGQPGRCEAFCSATACYVGAAAFNEGTYAGTTSGASPAFGVCAGLCATSASPGTWTVTVDGQIANAAWQAIDLVSTRPAGTSVWVRVKAANTVAALDNTPWWNGLMVATRYLPEVNGSVALNLPVGPFCVPPGRFLRLEVLLVPANGATPVVTSVCPRYSPTATCRPHPVCDENARLDPASGWCVCEEGWVGDGLTCSPVCVTIAPASPDTTAYNSTSDPSLWTFGSIGDNYWCSGCGNFTRSYYINVPSKRLLREARILGVGFDDWVTIWVNGNRVWCGPNGQCWTGGRGQRCELSTSWQFGTNVDLSPYLNQGNNEIRVQTIVAGCGESWINVRLDSGGRCN